MRFEHIIEINSPQVGLQTVVPTFSREQLWNGLMIRAFAEAGLTVEPINKVLEGHPHIVDAIINGEVQLVVNTTEGAQALADSFSLRRGALTNNIPYYTTVAGARAAVAAIVALRNGSLEVAPLQSYLNGS